MLGLGGTSSESEEDSGSDADGDGDGVGDTDPGQRALKLHGWQILSQVSACNVKMIPASQLEG